MYCTDKRSHFLCLMLRDFNCSTESQPIANSLLEKSPKGFLPLITLGCAQKKSTLYANAFRRSYTPCRAAEDDVILWRKLLQSLDIAQSMKTSEVEKEASLDKPWLIAEASYAVRSCQPIKIT